MGSGVGEAHAEGDGVDDAVPVPLGLNEGESVPVTDALAERDASDADAVELPETVAFGDDEMVLLGESEGDAVGESDAVAFGDAVGESVPVLDTPAERVASDADALGLPDVVAETVTVFVIVELTETDTVPETVEEELALAEPVAQPVADTLPVRDAIDAVEVALLDIVLVEEVAGVVDAQKEDDGLDERDAEPQGDADGALEPKGDALGDRVASDGDEVELAVMETDLVTTPVADRLTDTVLVAVSVAELLADADPVGQPDDDSEPEREARGDADAVVLREMAPDRESVGDAEKLGDTELVSVSVADEHALIECVALPPVGVALAYDVGVHLADSDVLTHIVGEWEDDSETADVRETVDEGAPVADGKKVLEMVAVRVAAATDAVSAGDGEGETLGLAEMLSVGDGDGEAVAPATVTVKVGKSEDVASPVREPGGESVGAATVAVITVVGE